MSLPLLIRISVLLGWGINLMTSFNLNFLLKSSVSKYSHLEVKASTYEY